MSILYAGVYGIGLNSLAYTDAEFQINLDSSDCAIYCTDRETGW